MSRRSIPSRLIVVLAATIAVAACDSRPTAPTLRQASRFLSSEGDTLECRFGWQVVNGRYECLAEQ